MLLRSRAWRPEWDSRVDQAGHCARKGAEQGPSTLWTNRAGEEEMACLKNQASKTLIRMSEIYFLIDQKCWMAKHPPSEEML